MNEQKIKLELSKDKLFNLAENFGLVHGQSDDKNTKSQKRALDATKLCQEIKRAADLNEDDVTIAADKVITFFDYLTKTKINATSPQDIQEMRGSRVASAFVNAVDVITNSTPRDKSTHKSMTALIHIANNLKLEYSN